MPDNPKYIVFDTKQMKPGCAILQAALGGNPAFANAFPVNLWLTMPTPDMKRYPITLPQLRLLVERCKAHHTETATNED